VFVHVYVGVQLVFLRVLVLRYVYVGVFVFVCVFMCLFM